MQAAEFGQSEVSDGEKVKFVAGSSQTGVHSF